MPLSLEESVCPLSLPRISAKMHTEHWTLVETNGHSPASPVQLLTLSEIKRVLAAHQPDIQPSENCTRRAAVAMILREETPGLIETLFIKRAEHPHDPWSGHMAFPGGREDATDPSLEHVAIRETLEETGLVITPEMRIGRLHDIGGGRLRPFDMSVSPFVFHLPHKAEITTNHEIADTVWVPLDYMADLANIKSYNYPPDPMNRAFPCFNYNDCYTIWGMTFRMLGSFYELFGVTLPNEPTSRDVE